MPSTIEEIFSSDGALARHVAGFSPRAAQTAMAIAVHDALVDNETLVVEAGTGTGKTFAYLVPALLSDGRVIISTGTKNLQDQLFHRDLPVVGRALGRPRKVALLKGRANYLCRHRLNIADHNPRNATMLAQLRRWGRETNSGDVAEFSGLPEDHPLWSQVTSTVDNCLGSECAEYARCHVVHARRAAQEADVVVINHHLLLADFTLKEEGFGELLPGADACVLDEAHQLPEIATRFFGVAVSARQLRGLMRDVLRETLATKIDRSDIQSALDAVGKAISNARLALGRRDARRTIEELPPQALTEFDDLLSELAALDDALTVYAGASAGLDNTAQRTRDLAGRIMSFTEHRGDQAVAWVEASGDGFTLNCTPLESADELHACMTRAECAWVLTSATLAVGVSFEHFIRRVGADAPRTLLLESAFDYESNAMIFMPPGLPEPNQPGYTERVVETALPLLQAADGGAFLLFTSHRALREAATLLGELEIGGRELFVQGQAPRDELLRRFREDGDAVLLGTASFWEGVDVPGDALSIVLIDKLPFAAPTDPVLKARLAALEEAGMQPFRSYQLPQAVLALKQGVGRLIRDARDRGVCVLCDPRISSRSYGATFLKSLPPMRRTDSLDEVLEFLLANATTGSQP